MEDVGIFYGHFVYFMATLSFLRPNGKHILIPFGTFCGHFGILIPVLVCCTKKNLATLASDVFPSEFGEGQLRCEMSVKKI
jgi:hypothetical protein